MLLVVAVALDHRVEGCFDADGGADATALVGKSVVVVAMGGFVCIKVVV